MNGRRKRRAIEWVDASWRRRHGDNGGQVRHRRARVEGELQGDDLRARGVRLAGIYNNASSTIFQSLGAYMAPNDPLPTKAS